MRKSRNGNTLITVHNICLLGSTSICKDSLQSYNNKIISLENEKNNKNNFNNEINKIKYPQEQTGKYYESWLNNSPAWLKKNFFLTLGNQI